MQRRKWENKQKAQIVLEGLKGRSMSEICNSYQISQGQYYTWRDQFLANLGRPFEVGATSTRETRLAQESTRLKAMVGELTMELKKSDELYV